MGRKKTRSSISVILTLGVLALGATARAAEVAIPDGSFENGPDASFWTEARDTAECQTGIWTWVTDLGANVPLSLPDGNHAYWAGGFCAGGTMKAVNGSVSQQLTVPQSVPFLTFRYFAGRLTTSTNSDDTGGSETAYVSVNGANVWTLDVSTPANNTFDLVADAACFDWKRVDLSSYANQSVALQVGVDQHGFAHGVGNVFFDDLKFADLVFGDGFDCAGIGRWGVF